MNDCINVRMRRKRGCGYVETRVARMYTKILTFYWKYKPIKYISLSHLRCTIRPYILTNLMNAHFSTIINMYEKRIDPSPTISRFSRNTYIYYMYPAYYMSQQPAGRISTPKIREPGAAIGLSLRLLSTYLLPIIDDSQQPWWSLVTV
jgi:hypothetical protein